MEGHSDAGRHRRRNAALLAVGLAAGALVVAILVTSSGNDGDARDERAAASSRIPSGPAAVRIGRFDYEPIRESSGFVKSRRHEDLWWTMNDSGNPPVVYATSVDGELVGEVLLSNATNFDWEDIAADESGRLWVGDIGDNAMIREEIAVYKFPEPDPRAVSETDAVKYTLLYPDGSHNAEGMFVRRGRLYVVTKVGPSQTTGVYVAEGLKADEKHVLRPVALLTQHAAITGADISWDGRRIALVSRHAVFVFIGEGEVEEILRSQPHRVHLGIGEVVEAVGFDGYDLVLTSEERGIYRVKAATYEAAPQVDVRGD